MMPEPVHAPADGWPEGLVHIDFPDGCDLATAVRVACYSARTLRLGVQGAFDGDALMAYPHQNEDEVERTYLRCRGRPWGGARVPQRQLWIDGKPFLVDHRVWAAFQTLTALNESMATKLENARG